jgi:hypothetical protein
VAGVRAGRIRRLRYLGARLEAARDARRPRPASAPIAVEELHERLGAALGTPLQPFLAEAPLAEIASRTLGVPTTDRGPAAPHDADPGLARTCYALCRALRPAVVVETGVANGVTSSFLLQALAVNGTGSLHSIDLPPPGVDPALVGSRVPDELREAWTLHRGASKHLLPGVVREVGPIGLFVHDSRHSYRNVRRELETVSPSLTRPAAVVVDDAERHAALQDWAATTGARPVELVVQPGKTALYGVALLGATDG